MVTNPFTSFPFFLDKKGGEKIKKTSNSHLLILPFYCLSNTRGVTSTAATSPTVLKHEVFTQTNAAYETFKSRTSLGKTLRISGTIRFLSKLNSHKKREQRSLFPSH